MKPLVSIIDNRTQEKVRRYLDTVPTLPPQKI